MSPTGRKFYGGGGISPDIEIPASQITPAQVRLQGAIFAFARELVAGLVPGLQSYRMTNIEFNHVLGEHEYRITDNVLDAFAAFVDRGSWIVDRTTNHVSRVTIRENREFIRTAIRFEVVTAAYGLETAAQALNEIDLQLLKAIEAVPRAAGLAEKYKKAVTSDK